MIAETPQAGAGKPIRYVVASHNHFDHTGGLRAFAAEGVTVITHEVHRALFEKTLAAPATIAPDHLAKSGKKGMVKASATGGCSPMERGRWSCATSPATATTTGSSWSICPPRNS